MIEHVAFLEALSTLQHNKVIKLKKNPTVR